MERGEGPVVQIGRIPEPGAFLSLFFTAQRVLQSNASSVMKEKLRCVFECDLRELSMTGL
jgi:hypothetical protein